MGTETKTYGSGKATDGTAAPNSRVASAEPRGADRRRCKRLALTFPIEVSGADTTGRPFSDRTITSDVSEEGCRFELLRGLRCGDVVTIRVVGRQSEDASYGPALRFEIMWVETSDHGWAIGASKLQPDNIWHMTFPKNKASTTTVR